MRVAIVNDMKIALEALRRVVQSVPEAEVAWMAEDGQEALDRCKADTPDLILMDMIMPVMDGVEATRRIMQSCPCPILVVTATVQGNADRVFDALGHGAMDAVNTPVLGTAGTLTGAEELVRKLRVVARLTGERPSSREGTCADPHPSRPAAPAPSAHPLPPIVAVGASTGGPQALLSVLTALRKPLTYSVVIIQHLDRLFVQGLAEWLSRESGLAVELIQAGQGPTPGLVQVACTTDHVILDSRGEFREVREPADCVYRPSVDVFFYSLVHAPTSPSIAVLLTGMGRDGAAGLKALRDAGWRTIAQDEATSVVWGMPGAAVRAGAATQVLPPEAIGIAIDRGIR